MHVCFYEYYVRMCTCMYVLKINLDLFFPYLPLVVSLVDKKQLSYTGSKCGGYYVGVLARPSLPWMLSFVMLILQFCTYKVLAAVEEGRGLIDGIQNSIAHLI